MGIDFNNFYEDLGIALNGREPSSITTAEIEKAYQNAYAVYQSESAARRDILKNCHPDKVRSSKEAQGLSAGALDALIKKKTKEAQEANAAFETHKTAYLKKAAAREALCNPETRKTHDEALKFRASRRSGFANGAGTQQNRANAGAGSRTNSGTDRGARGSSDWWDTFWRETYGSQYHQSFHEQLKEHIRQARARSERPDLARFSLSFKDLSNMDLEGCIFGDHLFNVNFSGANLKNTDFSDKSISGSIFNEATNLEGANFSKVFFYDVDLPKNLKGINFTSAIFGSESRVLSAKIFEDCLFNKVSFFKPNFDNSVFKKCSFSGVSFGFGDIKNAVFEDCIMDARTLYKYSNFKNITFRNMKFRGIDLSKAQLDGVAFEGSLEGLTLSKDQLKHVDLSKAEKEGLKVVDYLGRLIKNPFKPDVAENIAESGKKILNKLLKTEEGKIHFGKVTAVGAVVLSAGIGAYYLLKKNKEKKKEQAWGLQELSRQQSFSAAQQNL